MQCAPPRTANRSKCCRMCGEDKPDSEFCMWKIKHSARSKKPQACDTCLIKEEETRKDTSKGNQKHIQESNNGLSARQLVLNPKVTVFCPECDAAKEIDFDLIWKKGRGTNSFIDLICRKKSAYNKRQ